MDSAAFWDKAAEKYARDAMSDPAAYKVTLDRIGVLLQPEHSVLEIGCGTGSTALDLCGGVARYLGTDVSGEMVRIAEAKRDEAGAETLRFERREAHDLSGGPFDAILALNVLHLVEGLEDVVAEAYRTLPSGGLFISKTALIAESNVVIRWAIPVMRWLGKAPWVGYLSERALHAHLSAAGFVIEETLLQSGMAPRLFVVARKP